MLATAKLTEADTTVITVPANEAVQALTDGRLDAMVAFEPEPERARQRLGNDAVILQDKLVYRELFNLNTSAKVVADPVKRRSVVELVRTLMATSKTWRENPEPSLPLIASKLSLPAELIRPVLPEIRYAGGIVRDLLDVLVEEEQWVATERNRTPRTRAQLAILIDKSVLEDARRKR
jgi:NitT/TauT family transport system substrate-binding protein